MKYHTGSIVEWPVVIGELPADFERSYHVFHRFLTIQPPVIEHTRHGLKCLMDSVRMSGLFCLG